MQSQRIEQLTTSDREAIDAICDDFESAWRQAAEPDLARYARRFSENQYLSGLTELVILDYSYRNSHSSDAASESRVVHYRWEDYVERFPRLARVSIPSELQPCFNHDSVIDDRFQPLRHHASGGLGRVTVARDLQIGRDIAIKEIHARFVGAEDHRRRFVREAEITGRLEHPCIVPVYAMGKRSDGEPYYAMRLIQGRSLREAINDLRKESPTPVLCVKRRSLLARFMDVCQAVEYAHRQGVIHRDIKPDNIMLGEYGETLLVDWGLARPIEEVRQEMTVMQRPETICDSLTRAGSTLGTPAYMSPEQALGKQQPIDGRTDVFSLGATLYHILTGDPPRIRDGRAGQQEPFPATVPKPLRAICRKAMSERPEQRYHSAREMANDVELALADQPIAAYADPWRTVLRRWIQQHQIATVAAVVAACFAFLGLFTVAWITRQHAGELSSKNQQLERSLARQTELLRAAEKSEKRTADAMDFFVQAMRSPDPNLGGRQVRVVDVLNQAVEETHAELAGDPELQGQMLATIAQTYSGLSLYDKARPLAEQAYEVLRRHPGHDHPRTLRAGLTLAKIYQRLDDDRYESLITRLLETSRATLESLAPDRLSIEQTAAVFQWQAGDARDAIRQFESLMPQFIECFGSDASLTLTLMNDLANAYAADGQIQEAIEIAKTVYDRRRETVGPQALATIVTGSNYVSHLMNSADRRPAIEELRKLLSNARNSLGDDHYQTLILINRLGVALVKANDLDEAIPLIEESLERSTAIYGVDHPRTLVAANSLGTAFLAQGDYARSAEQFAVVYANSLQTHGPDHAETLTFGNNLATAYCLNEQFDAAVPLYESILEAQKQSLGEHHFKTIRSMVNLAATLQRAGMARKSMHYCRDAVGLAQEHLGQHHPLTQSAWVYLGMGHLELGELEQAREAVQACLDSRTETMADHWLRYHTMSLLGEIHLRMGDLERAETLLTEGFEQLTRRRDQMPAQAEIHFRRAEQRLEELAQRKLD